jgi:thioredoxin 1
LQKRLRHCAAPALPVDGIQRPTAEQKKEIFMANQITDGTFEQDVLQSDIPVLIDFWAPWCGPCRAMGPVIDELAEEFEGQVKIVKMNVDENSATPGKYGIRAIPTLILFKGGEVVDQSTGAVSKSSIKEMITKKAL